MVSVTESVHACERQPQERPRFAQRAIGIARSMINADLIAKRAERKAKGGLL